VLVGSNPEGLLRFKLGGKDCLGLNVIGCLEAKEIALWVLVGPARGQWEKATGIAHIVIRAHLALGLSSYPCFNPPNSDRR
jgi:hypothetical protein